MSAMAEALRRAGVRGPLPTNEPHPVISRRADGPIKQVLLQEAAKIDGLSDEALELERLALAESVALIERQLDDDETERPEGWRRRATTALSIMRARLRLVNSEKNRRDLLMAEARRRATREAALREKQARKLANIEAHEQQAAAAQARKEANIEASRRETLRQKTAFIRHAKAMLPEETYRAIWAAVNAEEAAP